MQLKLLLMAALSLVSFTFSARAQNTFPATGSAGIGTATPNASSLLDMESTSKGLLIPRVTQAQRNAISSPATGLMVYQTNGSLPGLYYFNDSAWLPFSPWAATTATITYNAGDAVIHNITVGTGKGNVTSNTVAGNGALSSNTTGSYNTTSGFQSLDSNTTGSYNTANGFYSMYYNNKGNNNTGYGYRSLLTNTTGNNNSALGDQSLDKNTTGNGNTAGGHLALYSNTTGYSNIALGIAALYSNQTGSNLVAIGDSALYNNAINGANTAVGTKALYSNTLGEFNTAFGAVALNYNISGYENTATGTAALYSNKTGNDNTANGHWALEYNTSGSENTASGDHALYADTAGYGNTAMGSYALWSVANTGTYNTVIGSYTDVNGNGFTNSSALGSNSLITASHQIRLGNSAITSIGGYKGWSNISDGRVKKNIKQNVPGLAFIKLLTPITYNLDLDAADKIIQPPVHKTTDGKTIQLSQTDIAARKAQEKVVNTGFIAQDVEKAARSLNYDFDGVDAAKNSKDLYGLRYSEFVVPLVKAVQELSTENDSLKSQINELKNMVIALANKDGVSMQSLSTTLSSASLQQNVPNPYNNSTAIPYTLPEKFSSAQIIITDISGKTLRQVTVADSGKGVLNVDASTLSSGTYEYSLIIDGKLVDTKKMLLAR